MARWSLARRLVVTLTASLTGLWLLAVVFSAAIVYHEISEVFDSALQEAAQRLLPLALDDLGERGEDDDDDRPIGAELEYEAHEEYLIYQIRDVNGLVVMRSHDAPRTAFQVPLRRGFAEANGRRYYTEGALHEGLYIQVGERIQHRIEALKESLAGLAAPLVLLVPLAGIMIFWTVRRSLHPIAAVREAIEARNGACLEPISDSEMPEELAPIVQDVNRLIARLTSALESERGFAANSAHELRTPVAAALAQTQRLAAEMAGSPHEARIGQVSTTLRKLGNLVEKLLQLARADSGIALSREPIDVLPILDLIVDEFKRYGQGAQRIRYDRGPTRKLIAKTDLDALGIVLRNIVENALTHGDPQRAVDIRVNEAGAIHVANSGAVVPAERLGMLTRRFERGNAGARGSGLGLAIAETITRQSGGKLLLYSPALGRPDGFEVVLCPAQWSAGSRPADGSSSAPRSTHGEGLE